MSIVYKKAGGFSDDTDRVEYSDGMMFIVTKSGSYLFVNSMTKESCEGFVDSGHWVKENVDDSWGSKNPELTSGDYFCAWSRTNSDVDAGVIHCASYCTDLGWHIKVGEEKIPCPEPVYFRKDDNDKD